MLKKTRAAAYFLSCLIVFSLAIQVPAGVSISGIPPVISSDAGTKNDFEIEHGPMIQEEFMDAATKNFLKGLSGTRRDVALIIIDSVNNTGGKVVGVGSWISGGKYRDPLIDLVDPSDHDLRFVYEGDKANAISRYQSFRQEVIKKVYKRFPPEQAKLVLESINIYPPESVLAGLDDAADALQYLKDLNINPNLGGAEVEGLWGKGAKAFRDAYEAAKGRLFWKEGSRVSSGLADLAPAFGEKAGLYTAEGSANVAKQLVEKIDDLLASGKYESAVKQIKRLRETMRKGFDLKRLEKMNYFDDLLSHLDDCCAGNPQKLAEEFGSPAVREMLESAMQRAGQDADLLLLYARETNPQMMKFLRDMLEYRTSRWARLKDTVANYAKRVREIGGKVNWGALYKGFMAALIVLQAYDYLKKATNADIEGLIHNAVLDATLLVSVNFAVAFVPLFLKSLMDDAIDYGYALVTSFQDCQDLIAGIYEVKGREQIEPNQRLERSIDQFARDYTPDDEDKVLAILRVHARAASMRNGKEDPKAEQILMDRCGPEVTGRWKQRRMELIADAVDLLKQIETEFRQLQLTGTISENEVWLLPGGADPSVSAKARLGGDTARLASKIEEFTSKIKSVGGTRKLVGVSVDLHNQWIPGSDDPDSWTPGAPLFNPEKATKEFAFQYPGNVTLAYEYQLAISVQAIADDVFSVSRAGYLDTQLTKTVSFEVGILQPKGSVEIVSPGEATAGKSLTLSARPDEELRKLGALKYVWTDLAGIALPSGGGSYGIRQDAEGPRDVKLEVYKTIDGTDVKVAESQKRIEFKADETATKKPTPEPSPSPDTDAPKTTNEKPAPLMFGGSASSIWERSRNDEKGFSLKRRVASMKNSGFCKWEANVNSNVWGRINPSFSADTPEEIARKVQDFKDESKRWGRSIQSESNVSIGEFKGTYVETAVKFKGGFASPDAGYGGDSVTVYAHGWLVNEARKPIEIGFEVTGSGCFNNVDKAFLVRQASAAQKEASAILRGLTITGGGKFDETAYDGPKLDGTDMPSIEIVTEPNVRKLRKGEIVTVRVIAKNVGPEDQPLEYAWTGDHGGAGAEVQFVAEKPGKQTLAVTATGPQFEIGSASVEFEVADLKVDLKQVSPNTAKVFVGVPVSFAAQLLSDGKPASGSYVYRFEPTPDVEFAKNDSGENQTTAVFSKPGVEKVWVEVLEEKNGSQTTVARSEQISIEILQPALKVTFDQQKALIGKAVKAKVSTVPADATDIDYRWEISPNANQTLESRDGTEVTFVPTDTKPVTVKVMARVPVSGESLGEETATITAGSYDVKVLVTGTEGPVPQVWKPGVGLVKVPKGIAVFQNVGLKATVAPNAENLRYRWTLNEDSHFTGGSSSAAIRVNRSQTGTCEATVVVTDANGVELGRGTGSFYVGISQEEVETGAKNASAKEKFAAAKAAARKGELDEAITLANEAAALNPKDTVAVKFAKSLEQDKQRITTQMQTTRDLMAKSQFPEAQKALIVAKNINPYYKPVVELEKELTTKWQQYDSGIRNGLAAIDSANKANDFRKGLELAEQFRKEFKLTPVTERTLRNHESWARSHEAEKERQRAILSAGESKFNAGDYDGAIKDFDVMYPNFNSYWNANIDTEPKKYGDLKVEAVRRQKRIPQLESAVKRAIELNPDNEVLLKQAREQADELIQLQPSNRTFSNYRAEIDRLLERKEKQKLVEPIIARGDVAAGNRKFKDAVKEYDKAVEIDPENPDVYKKRAEANLGRGDEKSALEDYNKVISLEPQNAKAYVERGNVHRTMKHTEEALDDYRRASMIDPKSPDGFLASGFLKVEKEDYIGAVNDLNSAIRLDPNNTEAYLKRAYAEAQLGDKQAALRDLNQAISRDPSNAEAYALRGKIKEELGDIDGARSDYEMALKLNPKDKASKSALAKLKTKDEPDKPKKPGILDRIISATDKVSDILGGETNNGNTDSGKTGAENKEQEIASVQNIGAVRNRPTAPSTVTFSSSYNVTFIQTYHWNNGRGTTTPGRISLKHSSGKVYGPWKATGANGQGGVKNAYWEVRPNTVLPAGKYTIVDSDPATWSQNAQSGGRGFFRISGYKVSGGVTAPTTTRNPERMRISVTYVNNSGRTIHMVATGERFGADNRLSPGGRRVASGEGPIFTKIDVYAFDTKGKLITTYSTPVEPDGKYTFTFGSNNRITKSAGSAPAPATAPAATTGSVRMTFIFVNMSNQDVHIFPAEGNTFGAHNKIPPKDSIGVSGSGPANGKIKIVAGRNGKVLTSILVPVAANAKYTVTYGANGKLTYKRN
ncbi:MAG: tetratricopeptide repeat protein [Pyrinomonadaceae bacterium]